MSGFTKKFNMYSDGKFDFLRLSAVNVILEKSVAEFCFVCPEDKYDSTLSCLAVIKDAVERSVNTALKIEVRLTKSHFDPHFFVQDLARFFNYYASLKGCIDKKNVEFCVAEDGGKTVKILLKPSAFGAFNARGLSRELQEFVHSNYCENIEISVQELPQVEQFFDSTNQYSFDEEQGRRIKITNADGLIGYTIFDFPSYIIDAEVAEKAILSGRIESLKSIARKPKDGKEKPNFFKFILSDGTGAINCVFFPSEKNKDKFALLSEGDEIVVDGKIENNTFNDVTTLTMYPRRISRCTMPKDFEINRLKLNVPDRYKTVFPAPYIEFEQRDFFACDTQNSGEKSAEIVAKKQAEVQQTPLKTQIYVVFDLETSGLDRTNDKIIEIGAVKIVDGVITETFSSFIDPEISIPDRITKLTGITDADIKNAPLLPDVLPDFLKFTHGATLVGHNIEFFDHPFLAIAAAKHNVYFDNPRIDTFALAKTHLKLGKYRLADLAAHYSVTNPHAHRALDDAITTAKVFLALVKEFDIKE